MTPASIKQKSAGFPWWVILLQGIFAIIIGALLLANPAATTKMLVQFLGIYWLIAGIFSLVGMFIDSSMWGWKLFMGIVGILAGIAILDHPLWSTILVPAVLVLFIGTCGLIMGTAGVIAAFQGAGWGAGILGVLSIILAIVVLASPYIAALFLPWILGILGVAGGIVAIFQSFKQRRIEA